MSGLSDSKFTLCHAQRQGAGLLRKTVFCIGDVMFGAVVGLSAIYVMHLAHRLSIGFFGAMALGMTAGMLLQMIASFAVAPILGSIESMVPSMIVGCVAQMSVCGTHLVNCKLSIGAAVLSAVASSLVVEMVLTVYAYRCDRRFVRYSNEAQ